MQKATFFVHQQDFIIFLVNRPLHQLNPTLSLSVTHTHTHTQISISPNYHLPCNDFSTLSWEKSFPRQQHL